MHGLVLNMSSNILIFFIKGDSEREASTVWNRKQYVLLRKQINLIHQTIKDTLFQHM